MSDDEEAREEREEGQEMEVKQTQPGGMKDVFTRRSYTSQ